MRKAASAAAAVAIGVVGATVILPGGPASAQVPQHRVTLTGAVEVPGPGDPNGRGEFSWSLDGQQLCYLLSVKRMGTAAAAHIHSGGTTVAGPVKVELTAPTPASAGCVEIAAGLATKLRNRPGRYYVNVHSAEYPGGAIRAQLNS